MAEVMESRGTGRRGQKEDGDDKGFFFLFCCSPWGQPMWFHGRSEHPLCWQATGNFIRWCRNTSPGYMAGQVVSDSRGNGSCPMRAVPYLITVPFHLEKVISPWSVAVDDLEPCFWEDSPAWMQLFRLAQTICCVFSSEHAQSSSVGELGILRGAYLSVVFPVSELNSRLLFVSYVGVAHTSCVHDSSSFLPSLWDWVTNLMLTKLGDVKGKFSLTLTKMVMRTLGKMSACRKGIRFSSWCSKGIRGL